MANTNLLTGFWMFLVPLLAILVPVWLGQRYGFYVKKRRGDLQEAPIGSAVGATLGLFAFMLGFTFQLVGNRYDKRKELMLNEITGIRASYLYAGLVPEPFKSNSRKLIVTYVDERLALRNDFTRFETTRRTSQQILDTLWGYSEALAAQDRSSEAYSLYISSINSLANAFAERITVYQVHLPASVLFILTFVGFFSMLTLGFQFGISGKVGLGVSILLAVTFAAVMWLVFALDRPEAGLIKISQVPWEELHQQLHAK